MAQTPLPTATSVDTANDNDPFIRHCDMHNLPPRSCTLCIRISKRPRVSSDPETRIDRTAVGMYAFPPLLTASTSVRDLFA